jgi:hypothetical protein
MKTTIKTLAFGNKSDIALTLSTKTVRVAVIYNAIAPMLSNLSIGHKTFKPVFDGTYKGNCPLCIAVSAVKGKAKTAVSEAYKCLVSADDQVAHDSMLENIMLTIIAVMTPAAAPKNAAAPKIDYAALYAGAQITIAELTARNAELTARNAELTARNAELTAPVTA